MSLSDILYKQVKNLWKEATKKPFVTEMANGTLDQSRYHNYMIQDYMYLQDYIDILNSTLEYTEEPELKNFLNTIIDETKQEAKRVHEKYLDETGGGSLSPLKEPVLTEYVEYMQKQLKEEGLLAGLTALLQCSWVYAYIGQTLTAQYPDEIKTSPYKDWFEAYTCKEYLDANQTWIQTLDNQTKYINPEETEKLCKIFINCATYENRFWDRL